MRKLILTMLILPLALNASTISTAPDLDNESGRTWAANLHASSVALNAGKTEEYGSGNTAARDALTPSIRGFYNNTQTGDVDYWDGAAWLSISIGVSSGLDPTALPETSQAWYNGLSYYGTLDGTVLGGAYAISALGSTPANGDEIRASFFVSNAPITVTLPAVYRYDTESTSTSIPFSVGLNYMLFEYLDGVWRLADSGSDGAAASSVSVDGSSVSDPDFVSSGDIDFVDTSGTITANINTGAVGSAELAASGVTAGEYSAFSSITIDATGRIVAITGTPVGDVTPPVLSSASLAADGVSLSLVFDESVTIGAGGSGGLTVDASVQGSGIAGTYASGDGTSAYVYTLASAVDSGETVTLDYVQPSNGLEDGSGNDLASISSGVVTNNSSQGSGFSFLETFENATDYDNPPSSVSGTPEPNYTGLVLAGSESLLLESGDNVAWDLGQEYDDIWIAFEIQQPSDYGGSFALLLYDGSGSSDNADVVAFVDYNSNGNFDTNQGYTVGSGSEATTNITPENTHQYVFFHYVSSTGSDGVFDAWVESTGTRSDPATNSTTDGQRTEGVRYIKLLSSGADTVFDNLEASDSAL